MKKTLILIALLASGLVYGQNAIDLANVYWRFSPQNKVEGYNLTRHFLQYTVDVKLPIPINEKNVFIAALEYQQNQTVTQTTVDIANFKAPEFQFASSALQLGVEHKWNSRSKMLFMAIGRLSTDYNNINKSHFQLGGLALGTTVRSTQFEWKYGVYYNTEFFGAMVVPLAGFNWAITEKWRLKTLIPINLELSYHPNTWFNGGLRFDGVNGSYRMEKKPLWLLETNAESPYLDKADNNVWLFTEFNLGKNVWFHLKAGHSVLRKYRFYDADEKLALKLGPVNIGNGRYPSINQIENGWSFECRFLYRLPLQN